jgi:hypothetical protein
MQAFRAIAMAGVLSVSAGCVGPDRPAPALSTYVQAPRDDVLLAAAGALRDRGYFAYLGNTGMVVGSRSEATVWTAPAMAVGIVTLPFFVVTWPLVSLVNHTEAVMWWPMRGFAWELQTHKNSTIYLRGTATEDGACMVRVDTHSPEERAQKDAEQVVGALRERFGVQ